MDIRAAHDFFKAAFPEQITHRLVGIEYEYPIVQANGEGIDYAVLLKLYEALGERGWQLVRDDVTGVIVNAVLPHQEPDVPFESEHVITTDTGFHTLEIGLAPTLTLQRAEAELKRLLGLVLEILEPLEARLLGYGIQPVTPPSEDRMTARGRYRFLHDDFVRGSEFVNEIVLYSTPTGEYPAKMLAEHSIFCLSAAGQTHVDVSRDEAILIVNALNITSGFRIAMLANSPIWLNRVSSYKANRELFWEWGWRNRISQTGIPQRFENLEHYLNYVFDFRSFMVKRDNGYFMLDRTYPFRTFFVSDGQTAIGLDGEPLYVSPELDDIHFQLGIAWFNARLQSAFGTVEDRCAANQPPDAHLSGSALTLGLVENRDRLVSFADQFSHDQANAIRLAAAKYGMAFTHPDLDVQSKVRELLDIAHEGLLKRGFGEEIYLKPLQDRVAEHRCPADDAVDLYTEGGVELMIDRLNMRRFLYDG